MESRLQELLDHHDITRTIAEYCFGCDRCDEGRMADVYVEDSYDDHGVFRMEGHKFAEVMTQEILKTSDSLYHLLGQSLIKVAGDEAGSETYFLAISRTFDEAGKQICNQLGGRFVDRLVRRDGRWRIKNRVVVRDWGVSIPVESDWTANAGLVDGKRSSADPAFAALGRIHGEIPVPRATKAA